VDGTNVVLVTASDILRYAAAFFFIVVAIALAYALVRVGKVLGRTEKMLEDIDREAVPLLRKSGETLDGVNGSLGNVDEITRDVADMTDKVNGLVTAVEGALQTPAKKAAAFGSGIQQAVTSFFRRDETAPSGAAYDTASAPGWEASTASPGWQPSATEQTERDFDESGVTFETPTAAEGPILEEEPFPEPWVPADGDEVEKPGGETDTRHGGVSSP
jgi:uncharacterized protein YoxC